MKTYVKIEGQDNEPVVQKLAKIALDLPEVCVWDVNMNDMGWGAPGKVANSPALGEVGLYLGLETGEAQKNCDGIISKTRGDLGDAQIYFEWNKTPTKEQINKLKTEIDKTIKPYGKKYLITYKN